MSKCGEPAVVKVFLLSRFLRPEEQFEWRQIGRRQARAGKKHMVVDLKVLDRIVDNDDPEHIKISFGESFFSSWRK